MVEFVITISGTFGLGQRIHDKQMFEIAWTVPSLGEVCVHVCVFKYVFLFILFIKD